MLKLVNISKTFNKNTINENTVFNDFSFEVSKGDFITIIGSNGAGKSTLLNIISGSIIEDKGKVLINGQDVSKKADYIRARNIGRVYQNPSFGVAPKMTILENLSLADNKGKTYGLSLAINKKRIYYYKELLKSLNLGLEDKIYNKVKLLSGGQRQALSLLMAVINKPDILLLDEHTAALDPKTCVKIMNITKNIIKENNVTTLMVTHNLKSAIENGNRLIMIHEGKIIIDISGDEKKNLTTDKLLSLFEKVNVKDDLSDKLIF